MLKAILKTIGVAVGLVAIPLLLVIVGMALSIVGPIAGVLLIIFLPLIIIGVVIGYLSAKKNKGE